MDPKRGPRQYFRGYKSSSVQQYGRNGCEMNSKYGLHKPPRPQRNPYKAKSNFTYRRNFQLNYSHNVNSRRQPLIKSRPVPEEPDDPEEEERKRKLNDTAIKLLNKIKTWNAESSLNQDSNKSETNVSSQTSVNCDLNRNSIEQSTGECSRDSEVNSEGKTKRIAHSKAKNNTIRLKKPMPKLSQCSKNSVRTRRYDVNKATVKDFQNRIQHKLINDIMQMPKESLQNVLNDPKINPIMELKMSHLVRENKLLIAQKLRALAESKMTSSDSSTNSLLLVDIDKLIDPVIETDLSVLPYELIKQMENIFQVEFDYTNVRNGCEQEPQSIESESSQVNAPSISASSDDACQMPSENANMLEEFKTNLILTGEISLKQNLTNQDVGLRTRTGTSSGMSSTRSVEDNQKTENLRNHFTNEDFGVYECSTDEDEDEDNKKISFPILKRDNEKNSSDGGSDNTIQPVGDEEIPVRNKSKRKSTLDHESVSKKMKRKKSKEVKNNRRTVIVDRNTGNDTDLVVSNSNYGLSGDGNQQSSLFSPQRESLSTGCQTSCELKNVEVQTSNDLCESSKLYGVPLPKFVSDDDSDALLEEVTAIQNLVSKLNERRFMIFLQLARTNPSGSFITDKITTDSFAETLSNGSVDLVDSLKKFFTKTQRKSKNHIQTIKDDVNKQKPWKKKNRNEKGNGDRPETV